MKRVDINCDLGELSGPLDKKIMPFITSCSIACGGHVGDSDSMIRTLQLAKDHQVKIGAHPSYPDKQNFGRKSLTLRPEVLKDSIKKQVATLIELAYKLGLNVSHVKAHGAYYNDLSNNQRLANDFIDLLEEMKYEGSVFGMPGSFLESAALSRGRTFIKEGFADRKYCFVNKLTSRSIEGSVYENMDLVRNQLTNMINNQIDTSEVGLKKLVVNTICLHSDTQLAVDMAQVIRAFLKEHNIEVSAY